MKLQAPMALLLEIGKTLVLTAKDDSILHAQYYQRVATNIVTCFPKYSTLVDLPFVNVRNLQFFASSGLVIWWPVDMWHLQYWYGVNRYMFIHYYSAMVYCKANMEELQIITLWSNISLLAYYRDFCGQGLMVGLELWYSLYIGST